MTHDHTRAMENAREAAKRLGQTWEDWLIVGVGMESARIEAMRAAYTNQPVGSAYNKEFSALLAQYEISHISKPDRSYLFKCMSRRGDIEVWRQTLTEGERFKLNHPQRVWLKWMASTQIQKPNGDKAPSAVAKLKEEIQALRLKCQRLEHQVGDGGNLWRPTDTAGDIATVLAEHMARMSESKAENVLRLTKQFVNDRWVTRKQKTAA